MSLAAALATVVAASCAATTAATCLSEAAAGHLIAEVSRQECSGLPIHTVLGSVQLPAEAVRKATQLMATLGLETGLDLQLLTGQPESEELMSQLAADGLALGHRAKVRLLLGKDQPWLSVRTALPHLQRSDERRQLQGSEQSDGLSSDTLAIVLSVMVGAAGYLIQALTARRAQQVAAETAQEQQVADEARERLHQQMAAQIKRIDRSLDDCCRPLSLVLSNIHYGLAFCVSDAVTYMHANQPEMVAHMMEQSKGMSTYISEDGTKVISARSGRILWDEATTRASRLLEVADTSTKIYRSAVGSHFGILYSGIVMSQPFACEIPEVIVAHIADDPTSVLAARYRRFVRHSLLPCMREAARLMRSHAALMELPPTEWLKSRFPAEPWGIAPPSIYLFVWFTRMQMWEALLVEWERGEFGAVLPSEIVSFTLGGLTAINNWAITRGEGHQRELIGCVSTCPKQHL
eukprot:SAG31_NODE_2276_length_6028_cov_44.362287_2_plen_464_part_00